MSGILFLMFCMLAVNLGEGNSTVSLSYTHSTEATASDFLPSESSTVTSTPETTQQTSHPTNTHRRSTHTTKTSAAPSDVPRHNVIDTKHCLPILMVTGGLIIACFILLISTFMLAWKVCHLSRRIKSLASNDDLISSADFWTGKSNKVKAKVETEDKEDTVLLGEVDQSAKEENVTANGDRKKTEEGKEKKEEEKEEKREEKEEKEGGEAEGNHDAAAEESSPTEPQEDASSSPPAAATTAD